jgi:hypothetical protein
MGLLSAWLHLIGDPCSKKDDRLLYRKRYKIIVVSATDMSQRFSYRIVDGFPANNKGLLRSWDCLLSPCGLAHSDLGNYKQQVAETSFFGNKKADIVTLATTNNR